MENDEVSGKITVDGGFYFIKCLNKYNQELTEANKANIVDKREKEAFDDEYNGFVSSLSSNINEELWENLELETGSGMKTDTFFEVFNTYCGDMLYHHNFFEGKRYDEGYDKRIANEADSWIFRTTFVWIFISAVLQSDGYVDRRTFPRSR